jgi:hypothetical protein
MGFFQEDEKQIGPLAVPNDIDLNPVDAPDPNGPSVLGAAFRTENPIGSYLSSYKVDEMTPFDPEYPPFEDIQGTHYEQYATRFTNARTAADVAGIKSQIDRELEDRRTLDAAGGMGMLAQFGAAIASPTSLLPGGAIVKGAQGVKIGATALSVGTAAGVATSIDEAALQATQETRTGTESAFAIGGSVLLGGLLGAGVAKLTRPEFRAASTQLESNIEVQHEFTEGLRSIGAAENRNDLTLRREAVLSAVRKVPGLRSMVRTSPLLRTALSEIDETRRTAAALVESPYQYRINEQGQSVLNGDVSVETRINDRTDNDLAKAIGGLESSYREYWADGQIGSVGTFVNPVTRRFASLTGMTQKLTKSQFMDEVGKALRSGDKHPIGQVQNAAERLRRDIFDKIKDEAIELGIFDEGLQIKNADSYFTRVYNKKKIMDNLNNGSDEDLMVVLRNEFMNRRSIAQKRLENAEIQSDLEKAREDMSADEFYASASDLEIEDAVLDTVRSITGLADGQHSYQASLSSPTRARVLDIDDDVLAPWLEQNAEVVMNHYFRSMVPDLEITRTFGDVNMTRQIDEIKRAGAVQMGKAGNAKQKRKISKEIAENIRDLEAMRDRMRGNYGMPSDPTSGWVFGGRFARTLSYTGYLGGMTLAAIPDVAGVIGRAGIDGVFGASADLVTKPSRLFTGAKDMADIGAAAEWHLQTRAMAISEIFDPHGAGSRGERALGQTAAAFSKATFMSQWNVGWKSIGGAATASTMAKAADAVRAGSATPKQLRMLSANGIEPWQAERIAQQLDQFGDKNGHMWLPRGKDWTDQEAFLAFRRAMSREFRMMVVTPGQDKPLAFSNEFGKFFFQFKSFGFSAYERILIAGLQKADADVFMQFSAALMLGGLVSNIKADMGGYDRKEGAAYWEDALDRSGLAGWLFEPYGMANAALAGRLSPTGEVVSRFQARSATQGALGPSVDMIAGIMEGTSAISRGDASYRDARKLMRPLPGNNLFYMLKFSQLIEDAISRQIGANPRPR